MEYDYEYFKKEILKLTQIDLNAYKERQMKRRIDTLIGKNKIVGYDKSIGIAIFFYMSIYRIYDLSLKFHTTYG